jgi:hypothetical protein
MRRDAKAQRVSCAAFGCVIASRQRGGISMCARHYLFHCRTCSTALWNPAELVTHPFDSVAIVCPACKSIHGYSLNQNSPHFDATGSDEESQVVFNLTKVGMLRCEGNCETSLPCYTSLSIPLLVADPQKELETWRWDDLKCSKGHRILKPDIQAQ